MRLSEEEGNNGPEELRKSDQEAYDLVKDKLEPPQ